MNTENNDTEHSSSAQPKFNRDSLRQMIWKAPLTSYEKLVMLALSDIADDDGSCSVTRQKIGTMCSIADISSVSKFTVSLASKGFLGVIKGGNLPDGKKIPNTFKIII